MSSANNKSDQQKMKLAPVRSMNDFLLDSRKYTQPAFNDMKKFRNRVSSNLLYYQTNYLALSAVIFSLSLLSNFGRLFVGALGLATTGLTALFASDKVPHPMAKDVRAKPMLTLLLVVLLPIALAILHGSMRTRGVKNKVGNKMEQMGAEIYTNTPMGIIFSYLGLEAKTLDE